jgi:SAM-dependent methyltransferase
MTNLMRRALAHPLTRGLDIDSPAATAQRRRIVREKSFLRRLYEEWYRRIDAALPRIDGMVLELGSGAGFLDEFIDDLITSEVFPTPGARLVLDGTRLPLPGSSLRAIVMTDVFHHIAAPRAFLWEAVRTLKPGGAIIMIEPWVSAWSRLVYRHLHHEPFEPDAVNWEFPSTGPLSGANGALPWIVFSRDRSVFENEFPALHIRAIHPMMPFSYLLSGGVSMRSFMPGFMYRPWRTLEKGAGLLSHFWAMFAMIIVQARR